MDSGTAADRNLAAGVSAGLERLIGLLPLDQPAGRAVAHRGGHAGRACRAQLRALRHRGLLTMALTALCYNWGFFTVLGYAPFPMNLSPIKLGLVFTGWGILVALFAVFGAARAAGMAGHRQDHVPATWPRSPWSMLVIAIWTKDNAVLIPAVIVYGIFIGMDNTVTTQAVMTVCPVERPVASAAYSFVRFIGGGLAPYVAGLVIALNIHVPFYIASGADPARASSSWPRRTACSDASVQAEQVAGCSRPPRPPGGRAGPSPARPPR